MYVRREMEGKGDINPTPNKSSMSRRPQVSSRNGVNPRLEITTSWRIHMSEVPVVVYTLFIVLFEGTFRSYY